MALSDLIVGAESGGNPTARNPRSSAYGAGQFIDSTWLSMLAKYRPDLAGLPRDQQLALRADPALSKTMTDAYAQENGQKLAAAGFDPNPGNTYLAHFAGPAGALKVLQADPSASAASVLGPQAAQANPFMANMTAGELQAWAHRKMGTPIPPAPIPLQAAPQFPPSALAQAPQPTQQPAGRPFDLMTMLGQGGGQPQSLPPLFAPQSQQPQMPEQQGAPQSFFASLPAGPQQMAGNDLANWWARMNPTG